MTVTRIGELDCRICVRSGDLRGQAVATRLDRLARGGLGPSLGQALARDVRSDPTYAVVAELDVALQLRANEDDLRRVSDQQILRRWSAELTSAVEEQLRKQRDTERVKVFADEPTFLASFLEALLEGRAWQLWYYRSLERHRRSSRAATVLEVLHARSDVASAALTTLDARGTLARLLEVLGPQASRALWRLVLAANGTVLEEASGGSARLAEAGSEDAPGTPSEDAWHPLLIAAWRIAFGLGLAVDSVPSRAAIVSLAGRMQAPVDARDPASLSDGVFEALRLLAAQGLVRPPGEPPDQPELGAALADLAWLDRDRLVRHLRAWQGGEAWSEPSEGRPEVAADAVSSAGSAVSEDAWHPLLIIAWQVAAHLGLVAQGPPARSTRLALERHMPAFVDWRDPASLSDGVLEVLRLLVEQGLARPPDDFPVQESKIEAALAGLVWLDRARLAESLRTWRAGTTDRQDRLAPRLRRLLDDLGAAVTTIEAGSPVRLDSAGLKVLLLARLHAGFVRWRADELAGRVVDRIVEAAARALAGDGATPHLPGLGEPGRALVRRLAALSKKPSAQGTMRAALPSGCAGVLLLVRALVDARLGPRLVARGADEAACRQVLRGLACPWSGLGALAADDPAVAWLAGTDPIGEDPLPASTMADVARELALGLPILSGYWRSGLVALRLGEACLVADPDANLWLPARDPGALAAALDELVRHEVPGGAILYLDPSLDDALQPSDGAVRIERGTPASARERVCAALAAFGADPQTVPFDQLAACALANLTLRAWASWLRGFERSSVPWLLTQLVRRPGLLRRVARGAEVWMEPRSLDLVLRRAGYLDPLALPDWLGAGVLTIRVGRDGHDH